MDNPHLAAQLVRLTLSRTPETSRIRHIAGCSCRSGAGCTQFIYNSFGRGHVDKFCVAQGLPKTKKVWEWGSPDGIAALFPEFLDPQAGSWPAHVTAVGYQRFDMGSPDSAAEEISHFTAGEPAVLFTPGTPMRFAQRLFSEGVELCRRLKMKGIFVTDYSGQVPAALPSFVWHVPYVSFRSVFPLCTAIVHHGGIGTSMECLLAGKPQLITPSAADQFWNASRMKEIHMADVLRLNRFRAERAATKIEALLESDSVKESCLSLKMRMEQEDTNARLLKLVESVIREQSG